MPSSAATAQPAAPPSADFQAASTIVGEDLAKALSHPLRIRIVVELNKRTMSPTQFASEYRTEVLRIKGPGKPGLAPKNLDRALRRYVRVHFQRLEDLGCIELVDVKTGGSRRGAKEHFYKAVQRTLFDTSVWTAMPDSARSGITATAFSTYLEQIADAMQGGTMDTRDDRHFTWTAMFYDEQGWGEMIDGIEALFGRSLELRIEAALRMAKTGERPIPVTVGLACFESPDSPRTWAFDEDVLHLPHTKRPASTESKIVSQRLAKAMAHPLRTKILVELNQRPMSPTQFAWEIGGASLSNVARHFRRLEELGCIELVGIKTGGKRRGGKEHFYRAVQRSLFDESIWATLPSSLRAEVTAVTVTTYIERVAEAFRAQTMDARDDRHFTWTAMAFDQAGWDTMIELTEDLFKRSLDLQTESLVRLKRSGEKPIPVTIALACFESPSGAKMSPIPRLERFRRALKAGP